MLIMAQSPFEACLQCLNKYFDTDAMISASFIVSERGFVLDREPFWIDTTENIYSSEEVMSEYVKWID